MTLTVYEDIDQGTPEWFAARAGIPTASVIHHLITAGSPDALTIDCPNCGSVAGDPCMSLARKVPAPIKTVHGERSAAASGLPPVYRVADGDMAWTLTKHLGAERITQYVEPTFTSADMERGNLSEPVARDLYSDLYAPAHEVGFMTLEGDGYKLGFSPDGLVGESGLLEIKAPRQKKHLATILDDAVPLEHMAQIQTGLFVSGREWLDFISYCGGMPLFVKRVLPDKAWFAVIEAAAIAFETNVSTMLERYGELTKDSPATERIDFFDGMDIF